MVLNDFESFTIGTIQIQVSFTKFENPKNLGIQPRYFEHEVYILIKALTWADEEQDHHACSQVSWFHLE